VADEPLKGLTVAILVTDGFEQPDDIPAFNREMIQLFTAAGGRRHAA
jgi:hypothetical protein